MSYLKIFEEKEHMIYLKLQMFLFFSEALSSLFYVVIGFETYDSNSLPICMIFLPAVIYVPKHIIKKWENFTLRVSFWFE